MASLSSFRKSVAVSALVLATFSSAPLAALHAQKPEKPNVRVALGGKVSLYYLPEIIAESLGYFKDEGLTPEFTDFAGGSKALQSLVGGSADVASSAYEHTIQMRAKGIALRAFALQNSYNDVALGIVKTRLPNYQSAADLKGKSVGVTAPGSAMHFFLVHQLVKAGLKPDAAQVLGVGHGSTAIAAAQRGELDAFCHSDPVMTELEMNGTVQIVADARTPEGSQAAYGGSYPTACLYAKEEFIKANPNTIQALANAIVRADLWLKAATPEQVVATLQPTFGQINKEVYTAAIRKLLPNVYSKDGILPPEGAETVLRTMAENDPAVRGAKINLADTYDNAFAEKALAKYRR